MKQFLFIKDKAGKTSTVEVSKDKTVGYLKKKYAKKIGIDTSDSSIEQINLSYAGKSLQNNLKLSDYNLQKNMTLECIGTLAGGAEKQIVLKTMKGGHYAIFVDLNTKISAFKTIIKEKSGIELSQQWIHFGGKPLSDDTKTLASYGVTENSTVHCLIKLIGGGSGL